jgi:DMSO/TMAO reductase YedYZ molybdopterin-dependent catalytic subunit
MPSAARSGRRLAAPHRLAALSRALVVAASLAACLALAACPAPAGAGQPEPAPDPFAETPPAPEEITQWQGKELSRFHRTYDNAVEQPAERRVNRAAYRLEVTGLVERPLSLTYDQVLELPSRRRLVDMPCVEGWTERLLYEGVPLATLLEKAGPAPEADTVVFHTAGGRYTSSLGLDYVRRAGVLLGHRINGLVLDQQRGFPFQVVAPRKLGYKWVKWVSKVELVKGPYQGFWEQRGYDNQADTRR